jgi:hypothetical protein
VNRIASPRRGSPVHATGRSERADVRARLERARGELAGVELEAARVETQVRQIPPLQLGEQREEPLRMLVVDGDGAKGPHRMLLGGAGGAAEVSDTKKPAALRRRRVRTSGSCRVMRSRTQRDCPAGVADNKGNSHASSGISCANSRRRGAVGSREFRPGDQVASGRPERRQASMPPTALVSALKPARSSTLVAMLLRYPLAQTTIQSWAGSSSASRSGS